MRILDYGCSHPAVHQMQTGISALGHGVIVCDNDKGLRPSRSSTKSSNKSLRFQNQGCRWVRRPTPHRVLHQRPGGGDALLFPTAELIREVVKAASEAEVFEQSFCAVFVPARIVALNPGGHEHVFNRGEFGQQPMKLKNESDALVSER